MERPVVYILILRLFLPVISGFGEQYGKGAPDRTDQSSGITPRNHQFHKKPAVYIQEIRKREVS